MNSAQYHGWRLAVLGAPSGATKSQILAQATSRFNRENIVYVGQGLTTINEVDLTPAQAAQVVAGKISATPYNKTIWGGSKEKILALSGEKYIIDVGVLPGSAADGSATKEDIIEYNEKGVITFVDELDGIRIREGVSTSQNTTTGEDEVAVTRIVRHVKYLVYDRAYEMLGQNITSTYKIDLEEYIKSGLEEMKVTDLSLIDIPDSGLTAYSVSVTLTAQAGMKEGKVTVNVSITPVHAARQITAQIVVM